MDGQETDVASVSLIPGFILLSECSIHLFSSQLIMYEQDGVLLTSKAVSGDNSNLHLGKLRIVQEVDIKFSFCI